MNSVDIDQTVWINRLIWFYAVHKNQLVPFLMHRIFFMFISLQLKCVLRGGSPCKWHQHKEPTTKQCLNFNIFPLCFRFFIKTFQFSRCYTPDPSPEVYKADKTKLIVSGNWLTLTINLQQTTLKI